MIIKRSISKYFKVTLLLNALLLNISYQANAGDVTVKSCDVVNIINDTWNVDVKNGYTHEHPEKANGTTFIIPEDGTYMFSHRAGAANSCANQQQVDMFYKTGGCVWITLVNWFSGDTVIFGNDGNPDANNALFTTGEYGIKKVIENGVVTYPWVGHRKPNLAENKGMKVPPSIVTLKKGEHITAFVQDCELFNNTNCSANNSGTISILVQRLRPLPLPH